MATPVELRFVLSGIGGVVSGIGATVTALDGVTAAARRTGAQLQQVGSNIAGFGTRISAGITAPLALATTGLVRMGAEAVESENLFEVSMGGMADAAREFSEGLRRDLGLNAFELRRQIGIMQNFTTAMGVAEETAFSMSTGVAQLAADMASFFNISNEEAFRRIQSGLSGEIEPLRRLGIVVSDAQVRAAASAMGLTGELSDQQRVLIRYNLILQQTQNAQGDLARTINSPANAMRVLGAQFQQLGIELGTALLPTIRNVVVAIRDNVVPVLERWIQAFSNLEPRTRGFIVLAGIALAAVGPLAIAIGGLVSVVGVLISVIGVLLSPIALIIAGLAAVAAAVFFARDSFDNFGRATSLLLSAFAAKLRENGARAAAWVEGIKAAVSGAFASILELLASAGEQVGDFFRLAATAIQAFNPAVADALRLAANNFESFTSTLAENAREQERIHRDLQRSFTESAEDAAVEFTTDMAAAAVELQMGVSDFAENVGDTVGMVGDFFVSGADFLGGATAEIETSADGAGSALLELGEDAITAAGDVNAASSTIKRAMAGANESMTAIGLSGDTRTVADVFKEWRDGFTDMQAYGVEVAETLTETFDNFTRSLSNGIGDAVGQAIVFGESFGDAIGNVAKKAVAQLISSLVSLGVQYVLNAALAQALAGAMTAFAAAQAQILAAAWAPAAALASLASFGANAAPANAALTGTLALAQGLASFQQGTDSFTATGPRLILVGENGPERVSVNPLAAGSGGGRGGLTVNFNNSIVDPIGFEQFVDVVMDALQGRGERIV